LFKVFPYAVLAVFVFARFNDFWFIFHYFIAYRTLFLRLYFFRDNTVVFLGKTGVLYFLRDNTVGLLGKTVLQSFFRDNTLVF
jgi:hypothetical protein